MSSEIKDAIQIADKHLAGASPERRKALAIDINAAIIRHAETLVADAIRDAAQRLNLSAEPKQ